MSLHKLHPTTKNSQVCQNPNNDIYIYIYIYVYICIILAQKAVIVIQLDSKLQDEWA